MRRKIHSKRPSKHYDGIVPTTRHLAQVIPEVVGHIQKVYGQRLDLIREKWPDIIGPQLASMTEVSSFSRGNLEVLVRNSTLHALLNQYDKQKIFKKLREHFPRIKIRSLRFKRG